MLEIRKIANAIAFTPIGVPSIALTQIGYRNVSLLRQLAIGTYRFYANWPIGSQRFCDNQIMRVIDARIKVEDSRRLGSAS